MNAALKLMTPDDFLVWCLDQEDRWELVHGVPIRMMTGATRRHDRVVVNLIVELGTRLRGRPCRPNTADVAARMAQGSIRRPDVTIDCGGPPDASLTSEVPTVFFEVLSPSTRTTDMLRRTDEYKAVPSLRHIVLLEPDLPRAWLWSRADQTSPWAEQYIEGLEAALPLAAIAVDLPLASVYDGVGFAPDD
jgi:Uma2 family endonuclease